MKSSKKLSRASYLAIKNPKASIASKSSRACRTASAGIPMYMRKVSKKMDHLWSFLADRSIAELAGVEDDEDLDNESVTTVSTPDSETSSADLNPLSKPEESYVEVPTNSPSEGQPVSHSHSVASSPSLTSGSCSSSSWTQSRRLYQSLLHNILQI